MLAINVQFLRKYPVILGLLLCALLCPGCADPAQRFGRTWYIDGAGNWGFGAFGVPNGLKERGYKGAVTNHRWSLTFNPALDQTLRFIARESGRQLGKEITRYLRENPNADANVIALSAGTGVGIWAIENVSPPYKVNNYVMTGSSLSSRYDVRKALGNMKGKIVCYFTSSDPVLDGPVRALGTIDGTFDDSAGLVGLKGPGADSPKVVNIGRTSQFARIGWTGGHADCVTEQFVRGEIYKYIVGGSSRTADPTRSSDSTTIHRAIVATQPLLAETFTESGEPVARAH
ncbi:MAG TPA: hypothetical protein P5081_01980 [Phycisphaerae bacterium]|nr:hypothetical protein [Phycisphaerae bacterium]HRW51624.1 hypothetical protein [Phycisphaerae bacterium]